ncbi:MAG TPA: DUF3883 domain-containing protein [bacterium]|jgi:hypothetical protein|nr:DUF3883 domain-containing protein [bacterium]
MTKKENYYVFKFNPKSKKHGFWRIENGIKCLKDGDPEPWPSPIPENPAPKKGDKIIIWESEKFYIRGIAEVVHEKEKVSKGSEVLLEYIKLFKNDPYTIDDAKKDGLIECFNNIKGRNDKTTKKLLSSDLNPEKLYEILLNRKNGITSKSAKNQSIPDVVIKDIDEKRKKEIGKIGEGIVLKGEKEGLIKIGKKSLAKKVQDVSNENLGYDILSFEKDGSEKYIEVKSTILSDNYSFQITRNELNYMKGEKNSWLYTVANINLKTKTGKIQDKMRYEDLEKDYIFAPVVFKVSKKK